MKVFVGGIITETNTFSPVPTGFDDYVIVRPDSSDSALESKTLTHLQNLIQQKGLTFYPSFIAIAEPGGITTRSAYEQLHEMLLEELKQLLPVDLIPIEFSNYCITAQSREHRLNSRPASLQRLFQASQQQSTIFS